MSAAAADAHGLGQRRFERGDRCRPVAPAIGGKARRQARHHVAGRRAAGGGALLEFRHDARQSILVADRDGSERPVDIDEGDAGPGEGFLGVVARLSPQRRPPGMAGQFGAPQEGRRIGGDIEGRAPGAAGMDLLFVDLPGPRRIAEHQGEQRDVPGDVAVHQPLARIGRQPRVEIVERGAILALLVQHVGLDVRAVRVARIFRQAALDQVERLVEPANLFQRERIDRLEPPVVGEMRTERLEEGHLLRLATLPPAEAYEAEYAGGRRRDHGVARMRGEMQPCRRQRFDRLALDGEAQRIDMALLARCRAEAKRAGTRRRLSRTANVGHQETRPRECGMGEREAGIGLHGARQQG